MLVLLLVIVRGEGGIWEDETVLLLLVSDADLFAKSVVFIVAVVVADFSRFQSLCAFVFNRGIADFWTSAASFGLCTHM